MYVCTYSIPHERLSPSEWALLLLRLLHVECLLQSLRTAKSADPWPSKAVSVHGRASHCPTGWWHYHPIQHRCSLSLLQYASARQKEASRARGLPNAGSKTAAQGKVESSICQNPTRRPIAFLEIQFGKAFHSHLMPLLHHHRFV